MKRVTTILTLGLLASLPILAQDCKEVKVAAKQIKVQDVKVNREDGKMTVGMSFNLDSLEMPTNAQLIYTPLVKTSDGTVTRLPELVINGKRQQIMYERGVKSTKEHFSEQATVVRRNNGEAQTVNYTASVPTQGKIKQYEVGVHEDLCGCGDIEDGSDYSLLTRKQPTANYVQPAVEAIKIRHIDKSAYIDFRVNRIELHPDYRRNPAQLDSIINTINIVKNDKNLEVQTVTIHGYASPEGSYAHNEYLAENRAKTLAEYVRQQVNLPKNAFSVTSTPEDWEGLINLLEGKDLSNNAGIEDAGENLPHRQELLTIAKDNTLEADARDKKLRTTYPEEGKWILDNWYPALRHSDYHIEYKVKPFDVEEAKEVIKTKPQQLSLNEMYHVAQTYKAGSKEFNEVMETAVRMFPTDETANLNAAITRLNAGDADGAKPYLDKAGKSEGAQAARKVYEELKKYWE